MKTTQCHRSTFRLGLLAAATLAVVPAVRGTETIHYSFNSLDTTFADPNVANEAPGAAISGTANNPSKLATIDGTIITVGATRYTLGRSLSFTSADADDGVAAGHIDTGLLIGDAGIANGTSMNRDFTAMAWVNWGSTAADNMIFGTVNADNRLHLGSRNGNLHSGHWGDDIGPDQGFNIPTGTGTWHHIAYVNQGSSQSVFQDGVLVLGPGATGTGNLTDGNLLIGTAANAGSFVGTLDEVKIFSDQAMTAAEITTEMTSGLPVYTLATVTFAILTNSGFKFEITDDPSSSVDLSKPKSLTIDGATVAATFSKVGGITTVTFLPAPFPDPGTPHTYTLAAKDVSNNDISASGTLRAPYFPPTIPGFAGSPGTWGIEEIYAASALPGDGLAGVMLLAITPPGDATVVTGSAPVMNHADPESPGGKGNFNNDFPFIGDHSGVDDNNVIVVGKTQLVIAAPGNFTFAVHSDDGFGLRISGGPAGNTSRFLSFSGNGSIDGGDPQSLIHVAYTGDSNTRGVYSFSAAGTYDVDFVAFEGGGGAFWEVAWAPGSFVRERDTGSWSLVGTPTDPSIPPFTPKWLTTLPGPLGTDGNWGVRTYLNANTVDNLQQTMDFLRDTVRDPSDGDGLTFDRQQPDLNDVDPNTTGATGIVGGERPFQGDTPADDNRYVTVAKARIDIPVAGEYTFSCRGDDGFFLRFKAVTGPNPKFVRATAADANNGRFEMSNQNELFFEPGTGDSDTRGVIFLPVGQYDLEYVNWEGGGGAWFELAAAQGSFLATADTNTWKLVGYKAQALPASSLPVISAAGWNVESSAPSSPELNAGAGGAENIAGAEAALTASGTSSNWDAVNFTDPQSGGGSPTPIPPVPWPRNTTNDDNYYSMRATGNLVVTTAGTYRIGYQSDDGASLIIKGTGGNPDPSFDTTLLENATPNGVVEEETPGSGIFNKVRTEVPTGNSRTVASISLTPGTYTLTGLMYEIGGGSYWAIFGAIEPLPEGSILYPPLTKGGVVTYVNGIQIVSPIPPQIPIISYTYNPATTILNLTFGSSVGATYALEYTIGLQPAGAPASPQKWNVVPGYSAIPGSAGSTAITPFNTSTLVSGGQIPDNKNVFFRIHQN